MPTPHLLLHAITDMRSCLAVVSALKKQYPDITAFVVTSSAWDKIYYYPEGACTNHEILGLRLWHTNDKDLRIYRRSIDGDDHA